jgi:hypothetical protein
MFMADLYQLIDPMIWLQSWRRIKNRKKQRRDLKAWEFKGRPVPPPHLVKQRKVKKLARLFNCRIFVETGTYKGKMIESVQDVFEKIYSIELDKTLSERAQKKFSGSNHIHVLQGDSGKILADILKDLSDKTLFWLDAHYSGGITAFGEQETPVIKELKTILNAPHFGHVILIDDARMFVGDKSYPTIPELRKMILSRRPQVSIDIEDDIIQILPKE